MSKLTDGEVQAILRQDGRPCAADMATRVKAQIAACDGLDNAIAAASAEGDLDAMAELLHFRSALQEAVDPRLKAARLRRAALDLDDRAERLMSQAAELFGRSAYRSGQGELALAADFEARAVALEACAADLADKAFDNRLEAAGIDWQVAQADALARIAA